MTAALATACLVTGIVTGWWLRMVIVTAEVSRSQERQQRKIRYWQSEAAHARRVARHLARQLAARADPPPEADEPQQEDDDQPERR